MREGAKLLHLLIVSTEDAICLVARDLGLQKCDLFLQGLELTKGPALDPKMTTYFLEKSGTNVELSGDFGKGLVEVRLEVFKRNA